MAIVFTKNQDEFLVDDADYSEVSRYKWHIGTGGYPVRTVKNRKISLARVLADTPEGMIADHIDGNPKNNHRVNIRNVTMAQNSMNRGKHAKSTSKYKGVTLHRTGKWQVVCNKKYLGLYDNELEAAKVYIKQAEVVFGEFNRSAEL